MTCERINTKDGYAIVCSRGRRKPACEVCKARPSTKLCDFPLAGPKAGQTCDRKLCAGCAVAIGNDRDLCPAHHRQSEKQGSLL